MRNSYTAKRAETEVDRVDHSLWERAETKGDTAIKAPSQPTLDEHELVPSHEITALDHFQVLDLIVAEARGVVHAGWRVVEELRFLRDGE